MSSQSAISLFAMLAIMSVTLFFQQSATLVTRRLCDPARLPGHR